MRGRVLRQIAILLGVALIPGIVQALYFGQRVSWQSPIPPGELVNVAQAEAWGANTLWIDARHDEEFSAGHYPTALPLNEDRWNALLPAVLMAWAPDKKIVVYCGSQDCGASRAVAQRLRDEGQMKNVFVLEGGWEVLKAAVRE